MDAAWEEGWEVPRPALRVLQLDSSRLDRLLIEMLQRQIVQAFAPLGWLLEARKPDVTLLLSAVLYGLTVVRSGATYGQRLLNLRYHCGTTNRPPRAILLVHFACTVLLPWVWQRANDTLADTRDSVR
jgi:predicted small integral membrane protein